MKNKTILVIEDETPLQEAIKIKLEKSGFDVVTARSVKQGLNLLKDIKKINVIWLDHYLLGEEDGLDFVVKVKNDEKFKKIPIFVVSNTAGSDKVQQYLKLGVEEYYTKADHRLDHMIDDIKKSLNK